LIILQGGTAIFNAGASYPLEGGYFYITPSNSPTFVYSLGFSASGLPVLTLVAQTNESAPPNKGVGPPTITTNQSQAGTAIMWLLALVNRLRAYYAVPQNGKMVRITLPASPLINKFQRPVFRDRRYYITSVTGDIYVSWKEKL